MKCVIVGGGITGLMAAEFVRRTKLNSEIILIERNNTLGGLLAGIEYKELGLYFDIGTHIFQETGVEEIDTILINSVSKENVIHFPPGLGDYAGTVFAGRLQTNTHFPDLRGVVDQKILKSVRSHIGSTKSLPSSIERTAPLLQVAATRFGKRFAEDVIGPVFSHAYGYPAEELSAFAMLLPGWSRVVIDDYSEWYASATDPRYCSLVAVPNQRDLPKHLHHGRRSFYSRQGGSKRFIDGLAGSLRSAGVELLLGTTIKSFDIEQCTLETTSIDGVNSSIKADKVILALGIVGATRLLGIDLATWHLDKPMPTWVINIILTESCKSDLCYLYGLDLDCDWYRLTNYRAFSGDKNDRRLTIEILGQRDGLPSSWPARITKQLQKYGFLHSSDIVFSDIRKLPTGFPPPTLRNIGALSELSIELLSLLTDRVFLGGIGTSNGVFFQNEVVTDMYYRLNAWV